MLSAFFTFCLFVTKEKYNQTKPQTNPKLHKQSRWSSSHDFSVFGHSFTLVPVWLMRNDGISLSGRVQFPPELGPECPRKGYYLSVPQIPFPLGRAGWVGDWSSQWLLCQRSCCCCFSRNLLEMCLCYGKSKLLIFLSCWHLSRRALFCVSTLPGVAVLKSLLWEEWEERRFLLVSNPVLPFSVNVP